MRGPTTLITAGTRSRTAQAQSNRWLVRILASAVIILSIATALYSLMVFAPQWAPVHLGVTSGAENAIEQEITDVSASFVQDLVTFDYRKLDQHIRRLRPEISDDFENKFHTGLRGNLAVFRKRIEVQHSISTAEVKAVAITSRDEDTATVSVFFAETIRTRLQPAPRRELHVLELTLLKSASGWRVDSAADPTTPRVLR